MADFSLAGEGAIWVQPDGPNTEPIYLGCHETGDITQPKGDVKLYYCPNPNRTNDWVVSDSSQGAPGLVTTSITSKVRAVKDALDKMVCPGAIFVHHVDCGKPNTFDAWDYTYLLRRPRVSSRKLSKLTAMKPDNQDETIKSFDISAESMEDLFKFTLSRISTTAVDALLDVTACDTERCEGNCGTAVALGDNLYAASGSRSGSPVNMSEILGSSDSGGTWSATTQYPFKAGEVVAAVRCFEIDEDTTRIVAIRGTADAGNPAEIAYSDDGGATWTAVNLGTTVAMYALGPKALFVLDYYNIWAVTTGGHIYFSSDGGASWTEQSAGITTQNLYGIEMSTDQYGWIVGATNTILKTVQQDANGQNIWQAVTGPVAEAAATALSLAAFNQYRVWITYNDGTVWYTRDGGTNWSQRSIGLTGGSVPSIDFYDEWIGVLVHNTAANSGTVLFTVNGGYTWKALSTPTNSGLNSVIIPTPTLIFAVGNANGGTAMIIRGSGG